MQRVLRIGTRDSQLAVWQATLVQNLLKKAGVRSELVFMKSEGDVDTVTPLYALGVTGVFTKTLDTALLNNRIDIAVHSMKDVPVQLAQGIRQASVLKRGSYKDILVLHPGLSEKDGVFRGHPVVIATSSIRRIAQWLNKYPDHKIENLRGNVNTRLRKLKESNWHGAIFAAAGLERIHLRPENSFDLDWMLPAPAQGAIMVVCREDDHYAFDSCQPFNDEATALCTKIEREFLSALMGGCSTPISALAKLRGGKVSFKGNIANPDGKGLADVAITRLVADSSDMAYIAAEMILSNGGQAIVDRIRNKGLTTNGEV
jgi:hydroxymethylbilane synthase